MSALFPKSPLQFGSWGELGKGDWWEAGLLAHTVFYQKVVIIQHNQLPSVGSTGPLRWPGLPALGLLLHTTQKDRRASSNGNNTRTQSSCESRLSPNPKATLPLLLTIRHQKIDSKFNVCNLMPQSNLHKHFSYVPNYPLITFSQDTQNPCNT